VIEVRTAVESDAPWIRDIFVASYGNDYVYPDYYDVDALRRMILNDQELMLAAVDTVAGRPVATASVILEIGAFTDLVGEFGRLAVHPDWRHRGIGSLLVDERVRRVEDRLHVGFMEARVYHPFTQRLARRHGFTPVGFLPLKLRFGERRESVSASVRYFGNALSLRRNHPRITPESYDLTCGALTRVGVRGHPLVDEESAPYPVGDYIVEEMSTSGYADLLRIERGRVKNREIFGPLRLHYGLFRLQASHSHYLLAKRAGRVIGGVGYLLDEHEGGARVFELITLEDEAVPFLLRRLLARLDDTPGMDYVEIDVSAYAPRMQRTLLDLGFSPAAYMPALAFHEVERLDVMRMVKLFIPLEEEAEFVSPTKEVAELVMASFRRAEVEPQVTEVLDRIELFEGLEDPDVLEIASLFSVADMPAGTEIFKAGDPSDEMWIVLSGEVRIEVPGTGRIGRVGAGECLGETALLTRTAHTAEAVAETPIQVAVVRGDALEALVRRRPSTGVVLYRNLASGLGSKLRRTGRGGRG
jgi:GNAT superfamily N-acetyltransferase/mannose-6-phosphate isomerase-like protein (cupin superfamily)